MNFAEARLTEREYTALLFRQMRKIADELSELLPDGLRFDYDTRPVLPYKPLLLDLFCGAGGASAGYWRAGFDVIGVDIRPQPRYPFLFYQHDAVELLDELLAGRAVLGFLLPDLAAIHASPPCQHYSGLSNCQPGTKERYPDLIGPVRERLIRTGLPYLIENVPHAPLIDPATLCGTSFGMRIRRHRLFEASFGLPGTVCKHNGYVMNPHNTAGRNRMRELFGIKQGDLSRAWCDEMGLCWMKWENAREAIPPAFTEYIGHHLISHLAENAKQVAA